MATNWTQTQIDRAREDFRVFLYMVWDSISLPEPTEIQYDIARALMNPPSDRYIIQGFRGVAKSFITCAFSAWTLWREPQKKVLIVSASKDRADANAIFVKKIIQTLPFLSDLLPQKGQRDTQNIFDVGLATPDISPSIKSVGITGQITGSRADLLISDDVEVSNNSATQTQRDKLFEAVREYDAILKPNGQIVYLGTPQNEMSLYNELQNRGYRTNIWTVLYPETPEEREHYGDRLAPIIANRYDTEPQRWSGRPTDPKRFNEEEIIKRRLSYGKAGFALQFMLNTNLSDYERYPLKVSDLIVSSLDKKSSSLKWNWTNERMYRIDDVPNLALKGDYFYEPLSRSEQVAEYTGSVLAIDASGRGQDETAYAVIKYLNGYLFVLDVGAFKGNGYADNVLSQLANKAKSFDVNAVLIESNFGNGMFTQLFTPYLTKTHPCAIEEVRNFKQKELRIIDTLEPIMAQHKLIIHKPIIQNDYQANEKTLNYSLFYQMTRISRDKGSLAHDDRLDALTMGVEYFTDIMNRDAQTGIDEEMENRLLDWLDPDRGVLFNIKTHKYDDPSSINNNYNFLKNHRIN